MTLPFLYQLQDASYTKLSNLSFKSAVIDMDDAGLSASQVQSLESQGKFLMT